MKQGKYLSILILCSLTTLVGVQLSCEKEHEAYYRFEDFNTVTKFDVHIHINTSESYFIEQAIADKFYFLDIVDDRPFGVSMDEQQAFAKLHLNTFPQQMNFATTFKVSNWNQKDWVATTIAHLKKSFAQGATAVKIWKMVIL
jgi:hypothetical protein